MTCPITSKTLVTYTDLFTARPSGSLWQCKYDPEGQGRLERLQARVQDEEPSRAEILLRGFYVVETIQTVIAPRQFVAVDIMPLARQLTGQRFKRSAQGLEQLIELCGSLCDALYVEVGFRTFEEGVVSAITLDALHKPQLFLEKTRLAARQLRSALISGENPVGVGEVFGRCLEAAGFLPELAYDHVDELLSITEENPVSPWNKTNLTG